ncbi:hypothetical protein MSPP1_000496 [Malassezia sp. CBS 17886]|nr:hypothetical protein MSPP1_000496 [Malassezia sp. CBS 17886]
MKHRATLVVAAAALVAPALAQSSGPSDTSTSTVISAIVLGLIMAGAFYLAFLLLRPRFRNIYAPKTYRSQPPSRNSEPLSKGVLAWIPQFLRTPDSEVLRVNGLDAYMFISYLNMCLWIIVPIWVLSWIVLMPLYGANLASPSDGFNMFIFSNVTGTPSTQQQKRAAGVLIIHYIFTAWILVNIHWRMQHFIKLRQEFIVSPAHRSSPQARSMLVTGVPNDYLSETRLTQLYSQLPGGVEKVWVNRNLKDLPKKVEQRDKLTLKLEGAVTKLVKTAAKNIRKGKAHGDVLADGQEPTADIAEQYVPRNKRPTMRLGKIPCCGEKVDTIDYCRSELSRLNQDIAGQRQQMVNDYEEYPPQSSAFVLFHTQVAAYMAAGIASCHQPYRMVNRYIETDPDDIVWSNLNMNPYEQKIRSVAFWGVTWATVVFWCIPVAIVGVLSQFDYLQQKVFFLSWIKYIPGVPKGIIKAVLPTAALAVLNMLLPPWLRFLAKQSGIPTKRGIELSLMTRFFLFQIIQNFLFLTIVSGIVSNVSGFVNSFKDPAQFVTNISVAIPKASTFFLEYVFLLGLGGAAGMFLQIVPLIVYYVKIYLLSSTPRTIWHLKNDMGAPAWGVLFPTTLLIVVIAFGYMILAPIMNGFASVTFFFYYLAFRYLFIYVYDVKPQQETAGMFFPKAINFTFCGLYLSTFIVALMYFFNAGSNSSFVAFGVLTILLLILTAAYHYFLADSYGGLLNTLPLDLALTETQSEKTAPSSAAAQPRTPALPEKDAYYMDAQGTMAASHVVQVDHPDEIAYKEREEHEKLMNAFYNPSRKTKQLVLWYPNDQYGIGRAEVASDYSAGYQATVTHAGLNEKGKVVEDASIPPGENL